MRRLVILALVLPVVSFGAEIQAGFPSQAIWASKQSIVEGEPVVLSSIVYNGSGAFLRGTLVFTADGTRIGVREFELPTGESKIYSVEWRPSAGEYSVAAVIEETSATLSQTETSPIAITVAKPPPPSVIQQAVQTAGSVASSSLPVVRGIATSIFEAIEPIREAGVRRLESYLKKSGASLPSGIVMGSSTSNLSGFGTRGQKSDSLASKVGQAAAAAALFVMNSLYLFYPLLALVFLGTLYFLARRIRRRPRD